MFLVCPKIRHVGMINIVKPRKILIRLDGKTLLKLKMQNARLERL